MNARPKITAAYHWGSVYANINLLAEFVRVARKATLRETGHECGHTFRVTVECRGHSSVVGDPDHHDATEFDGLPSSIEVRANSLAGALAVALTVPFASWFPDYEGDES